MQGDALQAEILEIRLELNPDLIRRAVGYIPAQTWRSVQRHDVGFVGDVVVEHPDAVTVVPRIPRCAEVQEAITRLRVRRLVERPVVDAAAGRRICAED